MKPCKLKIIGDSCGQISEYAALGLAEYVVARLKDLMLPDGRFKDTGLQAEFEAWQKTPEAALFEGGGEIDNAGTTAQENI